MIITVITSNYHLEKTLIPPNNNAQSPGQNQSLIFLNFQRQVYSREMR